MKKILLVAVVFAFAASAFAGDATTTNPTTTSTTTTVAAAAPAKTPVADTALKGSITKMDATTLCVKDSTNKEWTFKFGTVNVKDYKIGDAVEVKYEKDNLKSITKVTK